jgi:cytochrome c oxidase assembly protein subunit 15
MNCELLSGTKMASRWPRWPHRIGVLLALVVFPLIWVGGLVTTYDAGMAVPDWPGTYGYNMFLYPIETWLSGPFDLLVEHGHRLLGSAAGIIAIGLVVVTFLTERRGAVRLFAVVLLLLVIAQGVLGGIRVVGADRTIAKIHGCVGPAFFAAVVGFCVVTSRWWWRQQEQNATEQSSIEKEADGRRWQDRTSALTTFAFWMLLLSYLQLVVGAFLRHVAVDARPGYYKHLVLVHVATAMLIVLGTVTQAVAAQMSARMSGRAAGSGVRSSIGLLLLLVVWQFLLGLGTWVVKFGWPVWFENQPFAATFVIGEKSYFQMHLITAHVATGSLILAVWTVHFLRCHLALGRSRWLPRSTQ